MKNNHSSPNTLEAEALKLTMEFHDFMIYAASVVLC